MPGQIRPSRAPMVGLARSTGSAPGKHRGARGKRREARPGSAGARLYTHRQPLPRHGGAGL